MNMSLQTILIASLGGLLPALMWLAFWLREDARHPEPKYRIALAFVFGMIAVPIVLVIETRVRAWGGLSVTAVFVAWAFIEELAKFVACWYAALKSREADEPVDVLIYMLTTALGFTALENAFFLARPLMNGDVLDTIITGDMRFLGATLLHVVSSATVGVTLAFAFYRRPHVKKIALILGLLAATALHTMFNLFIIRESNEAAFATFGMVWIGIVVLMVVFEKVKTIKHA